MRRCLTRGMLLLCPAAAAAAAAALAAAADSAASEAAAASPDATSAAAAEEQQQQLPPEKLAELLQLSPSELQQRMQQLFDLIDADRSGVISLEEAQQWSRTIRDAAHRHQVKQEFITIDKDADGKITLEELLVTYTDGAGQSDIAKEEVEKRFKAVDKDNSGSLSAEEVTILMDPGKDEVLMAIEVEEIMAAQDKDKDGKISLEEFLATEGGTLSDQEKQELTKEFSSYDTNKDGHIDEPELRNVISNPHGTEAESQLAGLVGEGLAVANWLAKPHLFAVSAFTDQGELLRFPDEYDMPLPFKPATEPAAEDVKDEL